jgi:hypothetical protein
MLDYNRITSFLDKFKIIISQKEEVKNIVLKTISETLSHQIQSSSVKIKDGYIYIQGYPILRSEILIHKEQILEKLKKLVPSTNFLDIK